ncbi:uncharacterized protein LOC109614195 [Musca domestica]|uniref:Uncharacterized protein LOC109614195 n=1 Tax=Musca domestica TaxID=7370 RepID=A0A9J7DLF0_MUSDO|nr:uncharacterized protein LOC109614195 [Musca domestica]
MNRKILAVVPMNGDERADKSLLDTLWVSLRRLVKSRLLLLLRAEEDEEYVEEIIKYCCSHKAVNVVAIRDNIAQLPEYYSPRIFPSFEMRTQQLNGFSKLYPDQVRNMHKAPLRMNLKRDSNKSYILKEVNGTYFLGGHVGHLFDEFARFQNATITFPTGYLDAFWYDMFLDNETLDMSQQLVLNDYSSDRTHSNCYTLLEWCIMVPTASPIQDYMLYAMVFDVGILWLILVTMMLLSSALALTYWLEGKITNLWNIFFNVYIFNGMLGQPYQMEPNYLGWRSILYVLTCLGGIIINTTYASYLQSFNASPPTEKPINTLQDVLQRNKKILMYDDEFKKMTNELFADYDMYLKVVKVIPTFLEFYTLRDSFDTRYLYPVPEVQWAQYDEQQKFFAKRKFILSDICLLKMYGQMVAMQANSPFEDAVNEMIGISAQAGLTNHWKQLAFLEAVQRKRIKLTDTSKKTTVEPMKVEDIKWLMFLYLGLNCMALLCVIVEILWYRFFVSINIVNRVE